MPLTRVGLLHRFFITEPETRPRTRTIKEDVMAIDLARFTQLCNRLAKIDMFGNEAKVRPSLNTASSINAAITNGAAHIPIAYRDTYAAAVSKELDNVLIQIKDMSTAQRK